MDGVAEVLRQIRDGRDFSPPASILRISAASATFVRPGWPYSIADNVAHCAYWQRLWIDRLLGMPAPKASIFDQDWPKIEAKEWPNVREGFSRDLDRAVAIAEGREPHGLDEPAAVEFLARIAHHNAYHVGQWALMKRLARSIASR